MGNILYNIKQALETLSGKSDKRILMIGLDAAGICKAAGELAGLTADVSESAGVA